jgi:Ti-type conjugative transfer relaxase TraA
MTASIKALGAASGGDSGRHAADYYSDLKAEDYYSKDSGKGQWRGAGLAALGIVNGEVNAEQLKLILEGRHPNSGRDLVQGAGDKHRAGWDMTFSMPKSVSVIWSQLSADQQIKIEQIQKNAVEKALQFLEKNAAYTRRGKAGSEHEKVDGLITATYNHQTSRAQDPQLHTHAVIANLAERNDGTFGTIESRYLYQWKMAAGAAYRSEVANNLQKMGLETELTEKNQFKVSGVKKEIEKHFSQRRQQIEEKLAEGGFSGAKASEKAALLTRSRKQAIDIKTLHSEWLERGEKIGFGRSEAEALFLNQNEKEEEQEKEFNLKKALETLTEHDSTFDHKKVILAALVHSQVSGGGIAEAEAKAAELLSQPEVIKLSANRYTTADMLVIEKTAIENSINRQAEKQHILSEKTVSNAIKNFEKANGFKLSDEQQLAVKHITAKEGGIKVVEGMAGTGKSTMAEAAKEAWVDEGYKVRGAALSGIAAEGLEKGSGIKSQTIASLLIKLHQGREKLDSKTILVLDEAGMVGSRQMSEIINHVEKAKAKLVLIGDSKQLQAINAGGIFNRLSRELGHASLTDIRRQKEAWAKEMVHDFAAGRSAEGLSALNGRGYLEISETQSQQIEIAAQNYFNSKTELKEKLIIAATRSEVGIINSVVRDLRQDELGEEITFHNREYAIGDRVMFFKNNSVLGVKNGTGGIVTAVGQNAGDAATITVITDNGRTTKFNENEYEDLNYGYAATAHKSQGVTVDQAHVVVGEFMGDREWSYVATSRARESVQVYLEGDKEELQALLKDAAKSMAKSNQKDTSLDHLKDENMTWQQQAQKLIDEAEERAKAAAIKYPVQQNEKQLVLEKKLQPEVKK